MDLVNDPIFQWLSQYAYQPEMVYSMIIFLMLASSFGLPLPEEVTLISGSVLAYMASNPDKYPPPEPGAAGVEPMTLALVCFFAVFLSDLLIYGMGRFFGSNLMKSPRFKRVMTQAMIERVEGWTKKYGIWAVAVFRFTPGIRFPGHLACGMLSFPIYKFVLIDGLAALLSVPTQVFLIAYYGEAILVQLRQFKVVLFVLLAVALVGFAILKFRQWSLQRASR